MTFDGTSMPVELVNLYRLRERVLAVPEAEYDHGRWQTCALHAYYGDADIASDAFLSGEADAEFGMSVTESIELFGSGPTSCRSRSDFLTRLDAFIADRERAIASIKP